MLPTDRPKGDSARMTVPATLAGGSPVLKPSHLEAVVSAAQESHAPATRRHYRSAWKTFEKWCARHGYTSLPAAPETVAAYFAERAGHVSVSALKLDRAAIRHKHASDGLESPTTSPGVAKVLRGLTRRAAVSRTIKQAKGLTASDLAAIRATAMLPRSGPTGRTESEESARTRGAVDIALISVMRDALLRRSEAVALTWADISFKSDGSARLTIRRSKTDQEGSGAVQYIGKEAADALRAIQSGDDDGTPIFGLRSSRAVSNRIKAAAKAAGLNGNYSGHSPRVGMAQDLAEKGVSTTELMVAGRWLSSRMPALYTREQAAGRGAVARYYTHGRG